MRHAIWCVVVCSLAQTMPAQDSAAQDPVHGIVELFQTYRIVMLGEMVHGGRQQFELLYQLIAAPGFTGRVNDIVLEFGNTRYQDVVDRYIAGENVPVEQVDGAWQDTVGALGPTSPIYGEFYRRVRAVNQKLPEQRRLRVLLGDPPINWNDVRSREDIGFYLPFRDQFYASVVRYQVLAKKRRALLIMGQGHFRRSGGQPSLIENELLAALVKPYVIIAGSNMVRGYDDLDARFDSLTAPSLVEMKRSWVGSLPSAGRGGTTTTWDQTADAYLYLGPRDRLTVVKNRRSDLDGTAYGKEIERRLTIIFDKPPDFLPKPDADTEQPAFSRTQAPGPPLPMLPRPRP